jgi:hypothetical protein
LPGGRRISFRGGGGAVKYDEELSAFAKNRRWPFTIPKAERKLKRIASAVAVDTLADDFQGFVGGGKRSYYASCLDIPKLKRRVHRLLLNWNER